MRENVKKLQNEIKELATKFFQAVYEIDGLLSNANEILIHFEKLDWDELKSELPNWNNDELQILASTISNGDDNGNILDDDFFYGYVFTLVDDSTSRFLLQNMFNFLDNVISENLLKSMILKLSSMNKNGYLEQEEYEYWINRIENNVASR